MATLEIEQRFKNYNLVNEFTEFIQNQVITDWEFEPSFGLQILKSLNKDNLDLYYFFHTHRGDVFCLLDQAEENDADKLSVVWLGAEGIPRNKVADNVCNFLKICHYGSGILYDVTCTIFDYVKYNDPDPEIIYPQNYIDEMIKTIASSEQNYSLLIDWLQNKQIDRMMNLVTYLKKVIVLID